MPQIVELRADLVRKYKEKNRAKRASKLSEELLGQILLGFTMGLNPTEIASALPVSVLTIRSTFDDFRNRLGAVESQYYYAAFFILDQHWPEPAFFGTLKALQKMGMGFRFQQDEIRQTYDCVFSCPASLPPKRLKNAYEAEKDLPRPNLINPKPKEASGSGEAHDRYSCRSCPNVWLRKNVSAKFLDNVAIQLAYYRGIKRDEFRPYFLAASMVAMLNRFLEVQFEVSMEKLQDVELARSEADEKYGHVVHAITHLAFDILSGRKLEWRDMKDDEQPWNEVLY